METTSVALAGETFSVKLEVAVPIGRPVVGDTCVVVSVMDVLFAFVGTNVPAEQASI